MKKLSVAVLLVACGLLAQVPQIPSSAQLMQTRSYTNAGLVYLDTYKIRFMGPWSGATSYMQNDMVIYSGSSYVGVAPSNLGNTPSPSSLFWTQLPGGNSGTWGSITGTISAQTDLTTALSGKQNTITTGLTTQYLRGDLSLATFPTTWSWSNLTGVPTITNTVFSRSGIVTAQSGDYNTSQVTESGNLYFTNARVWAAVAADSPLSFNNLTGHFSCPSCLTSNAVSSVFGRTGAVTAGVGDYTASQVTNAVDQTATYSNPGWLTTLAWGKITSAPSFANVASTNTYSGGGLQDLGAVDLKMPVHASDPGTCAAGQMEFNSTATSFKGCTAANTWGAIGGSTGWRSDWRCYLQGGETGCMGSTALTSAAPGLSSSVNPNDPLFSTGTYASLPAAGAGKTYKVTDATSSACSAGGGSTVCYLQSNGTAWNLVTTASGFWAFAGGSAGYWQYKFVLPSAYVAGNVNMLLAYRSADSTDTPTYSFSAGCVSTGVTDTASLSTTGSGNLTVPASGFGRTTFTTTLNPSCAAGNTIIVQLAVTPGSSTASNELQLTEVVFYQ